MPVRSIEDPTTFERTFREILAISMPRFKDAPLEKDRFRLFKLIYKSSQQTDGDIEVHVQTFKIHRAPKYTTPKYTAISYCWGDLADGTETIICNGQPFTVWINLHGLLRRIHRERSESWYWNDAICIEQGEDDVAVTEKAQQITFMETIFKFARPVQVWLGDASEDEERAFHFLADMCSRLRNDNVLIDGTGMPDGNDEVWILWSQVMLRSWFSRLWVVQEALVSEGNVIITIGRQAQVSWLIFKDMMERINGSNWTAECPSYNQIDRRAQKAVEKDLYLSQGMKVDEWVRKKKGGTPEEAISDCIRRNSLNFSDLTDVEESYNDTDFGYLQQVLKLFSNRFCAYDQDRPNAMRGILPEKLRHGQRVYSIHIDLPTVYREVSRLWLTNDPSLSLLQRIRPLPKFLPKGEQSLGTKLKTPSWVIDLERVVVMAMGFGEPNRTDGFHAGLVRKFSILRKAEWSVPKGVSRRNLFKKTKNIEFPNDYECHLVGVEVGVVDAIVTESNIRDDPWSIPTLTHTALGAWFNESLNLVQRLTGDVETAKEIHWRSIVLDHTDMANPLVTTMIDIEDQHSRREIYDKVSIAIQSRATEPESLSDSNSGTSRFYTTMENGFWAFPTWYSTTNSLVGRSYAVPLPGDVVAVFYGAATTFLLRPLDGRQSTFEFMGASYTQGVMQGEALLGKNNEKYPERKFILV